jgi:hemoglobin
MALEAPDRCAMSPERLLRHPLSPAIDETIITALVHEFYAKVRNDEKLGPIFKRVIGDDWDQHLAKMCDFWSSVMLQTGDYKGNPMVAHLRLKMVRPEHFERWLALFTETVTELCVPEVANLFIAKAESIARSLQLGMFYRPLPNRRKSMEESSCT